MSQYLVLCLFFALTFAWHQCVPMKVRDRIVPWAFALMMCNVCCSTFYGGGMHAILGIFNYALFAIVCDGFGYGRRNQNPTWIAVVALWVYMIFSSIYGKYCIDGFAYWLNTFLTSFCPGYFLALWLLRTPGGLRRLSLPMVLLSFLTVILYARHGGMTQVEAGVNRAAFDMETMAEDVVFNLNAVAIYMILLLVFMTIIYMRTPLTRRENIIKYAALGVAVPLTLIMIRAGSRAGALCLAPICLYFLFSTGNGKKKVKRILLFIVGTLIVIVGVRYMMKGADYLRAFSMKNDAGEGYYGSFADQMTTGRTTMWLNHLESMTTGQLLAGHGLVERNEITGRVTPGNAHSMYMTVMYNSGVLGISLMIILIVMAMRESRRIGDRGRMALMFIGVWLIHGIGESWGMTGGGTAILGGIGFGLLSRCQIRNFEFLGKYNPRVQAVFFDPYGRVIEYDKYLRR